MRALGDGEEQLARLLGNGPRRTANMGLQPTTDQTAGEESQGGRPAAEVDYEELSRGVDEKKLVRKLDLYIIPLVMGLYLFSFLDRYAPRLKLRWNPPSTSYPGP